VLSGGAGRTLGKATTLRLLGLGDKETAVDHNLVHVGMGDIVLPSLAKYQKYLKSFHPDTFRLHRPVLAKFLKSKPKRDRQASLMVCLLPVEKRHTMLVVVVDDESGDAEEATGNATRVYFNGKKWKRAEVVRFVLAHIQCVPVTGKM